MIGYLAEAKDWSAVLDRATSPEALRTGIRAWAPFVKDAQAIAKTMDAATFAEFRVGLAKERKGEWAGEQWQRRFGALLLPTELMEGSIVAERYHVPLGCALLRMHQEKAFQKSAASPETP